MISLNNNDKKPFFSIIVPVYQAESSIANCIESVKRQEYNNWELILVDDGSSDNSYNICASYAKNDNRIQVISQRNTGAAGARNKGTSMAQGEYILYLDSDDYWEGKEALCHLSDKIQETNCDICLFGCWDEFADTGERKKSRGNYNKEIFYNGTKKQILESLIKDSQFPGSCWIMAINTSFIMSCNIEFITGHRAEDIDWIMQVLSQARKISYIEDAFYIYKKNQPNSITGTAGLKSINDILDTINNWSGKLDYSKTEALYLNTYLVYIFFTTFVIYGNISKSEKKQAQLLYRNTEINVNRVIGLKYKALAIFYKVFGLKITAYIINHVM